MTDELQAASRDLFRAARDGLSPAPSDLERVRARVRAAAAGGAAGASASSAAPATVVVAAIAGLSAIAWWMTRAPAPAAMPAPASVAAPAPREVAPPAPIPPPAPVVVTALEEPAPIAPRASHRPRKPTAAPAISAPPPADADPLAAELAHLHDATAALAAGDPATALAIARAARAERPDGQLAAEIAAIEIDALCALDRRDEARAAAAEVLARWPTSTLRARVNASCAAPQQGAP